MPSKLALTRWLRVEYLSLLKTFIRILKNTLKLAYSDGKNFNYRKAEVLKQLNNTWTDLTKNTFLFVSVSISDS